MDWDKLRVFHAVASAGSFTHAGNTLGLSQSAVSRQIGALEEELDVMLFQRHARGLHLTEQGELLFRTTRNVFGMLDDARVALMESKDKPRGELKVTASVGITVKWLMPRLPEFYDEFPDISVNVIVADHELDLAGREADVAIRMRAPVQSDLIQRRLFNVRYGVFAAENYLEKKGEPKTLDELDCHRLITYGELAAPEIRGVNWLIENARRGHPRAPALAVNNIQAMAVAIDGGLGLGLLPKYYAADMPRLRHVLPDAPTPHFEAHLVYAETLRNSKRVAVFRDFLYRHAKDWEW
jgi:DNA-binding transcriptional LysR family regulator